MENLTHLSDETLLSGIDQAVGNSRQLEVRLLAYLGEIEERRLELRAGYSSMFDFCTARLRMSGGEAHRRLVGARLMRRFPVLSELVESGAINITGLELMRPYLNEQNHLELLAEASFKTKEEIQKLLARRFPRPDVPDTIRGIAERRATTPQPPTSAQPLELRLDPSLPAHGSGSEPLSPGRYAVRFTASERLCEKLERCKNLMAHTNPSFDLAVVVERAVDLLLDKLEKKKLGKTDRPRKACEAKHGAITQAARRTATDRDGEQCAWVDPTTGRRCTARAFLEIDHVTARALGGSGGPSNARWLCARHNRLHAEQTFGRDTVEKAIRFRQQKCRRPDSTPMSETHSKVLSALTNMGFRAREARAAVEQVRAKQSEQQTEVSLELVLREALSVLSDTRARSG